MIIRLKNIHRVKAGKTTYLYHRITRSRLDVDRGGRPRSQAEIVDAWKREEATIAGATVPDSGTVGHLITAYRGSPEFLSLAPRTQADYRRIFDFLEPLRQIAVGDIDTPAVMRIRDKAAEKKGRRMANYVIAVLSLLFNWAKPRGLATTNPAADAQKIRRPRGEPESNRAWSAQELATVLDAAPPELRVAIALGAYGALREGDVLAITWEAWDGVGLTWRAAKTGQTLYIPAHRALKAVLDAAPRRGPTIVTGARGRAFTSAGFRARFFKVIRALHTAGAIGPGLTFHGLRHTAATALAEAGCDDRDIASITGHKTASMVQRYTKAADQKRRAHAAMEKLEADEVVKPVVKNRDGPKGSQSKSLI